MTIKFPSAGQECPSCTPRFRANHEQPMRLVNIGRTMNHNTPIAICPWCDGERIVQIFNKK